MFDPDTQTRLQLVREMRARLQREAWLDRLEVPAVAETPRRHSPGPLERLWQSLRPAAGAS